MKYISWLWSWIPWLKSKKAKLPVSLPDTKPIENSGCGCVLADPLVVPLSPAMGMTDAEVDGSGFQKTGLARS
jgi:hypothetical protein